MAPNITSNFWFVHNIYLYRNGGIIKTKWNEEFIKMEHFKMKGFFNKGVSEAIDQWGKEGAAQEVLRRFYKS